MAVNIGPRIGIDGEGKYRQEMQRIIQQGKTLEIQMAAVASSFDESTSAEEKLAAQSKLAEKRIETQRELVSRLRDMVERSTEATGSNSTATLKWQEALARAETDLNRMEHGTKELGTAMDEAGDNAVSFGDVLKANLASEVIVQGLKAAAGAVKAAGEAAFDATKAAGAYADEILTLSVTTGLSIEQLQEFKYMEDLVDVSLDTLTGSMSKLIPKMASARKGDEAATKAFNALGVSVTGLNGELLDNRDVFFDVIDALALIEDPTERDALAMEIFGKSAQALNPLIMQGSKGLKAYAKEAHDVGYVLDDKTLGELGALDDSFQRLNTTSTTIKNQFGSGLAPAVETLNNKLADFAQMVDWEAIGARAGDVLGALTEKALGFAEQVDLDKVVTSIENGFEYLDNNGERIAGVVGAIGGAWATWKAGEIVGTILTNVKQLYGWLGALAGALGVSMGTLAGGAALAGVTVAGVAKEFSDITTGGKLGANQKLEEYRANAERLKATLDELVEQRENLPWYAPQGTLESLNRQINVAQAQYENAKNELAAMEAAAQETAAQAPQELSSAAQQAAESAQDATAAALETISESTGEIRSDWAEGLDGMAEDAAAEIIAANDAMAHNMELLAANASVWGEDAMLALANGIRLGTNNWVLPALDEVTAVLAARPMVAAGGGSSTVNYGGVNVAVYGSSGQSADELYDVFTERLQQDVAGQKAVFGD